MAVNDVKEYDYGNSWVWNELVDGNKVTLNVCQRSDDRLYNIYKDMENVNKDMFKSIKGLRKATLPFRLLLILLTDRPLHAVHIRNATRTSRFVTPPITNATVSVSAAQPNSQMPMTE